MANPLPSGSAVVLPRTLSLRERLAPPVVAKEVNPARRRRGEDHPSLPPLPNDIQSRIFSDCTNFLYYMFISAFYLD
jgi:hypothetical protein